MLQSQTTSSTQFPTLQTRAGKYVELIDGKPTTSSKIVANAFDKEHKNVLRYIDSLEIPENFRKLNFEPTSDLVAQPRGGHREERIIRMTRDGFMLVVMGFTGSKAVQTKIAFIEAFNRMEQKLQAAAESRIQHVRQPSILEEITDVREVVDLLRFKNRVLEERASSAAISSTAEKSRQHVAPVTAEEKAEAVRLFGAGMTVYSIAKKLGRHTSTIKRIIDRRIESDDEEMIDLTDGIYEEAE